MLKRPLLFLTLIFISVLGLFPQFTQASEVPKPVGDLYVQDTAHILTNEEREELISLARVLDDETSAQIAVLTMDKLDGHVEKAQFANKAYREYGLGKKDEDNGVLILFVKNYWENNREAVQVEVGYGLEGALPDGKVGRIIDQYMKPHIEAGNDGLAITETYQQLAKEVAKEYGISFDHLGDNQGSNVAQHQEEGLPAWVVFILIIVFAILIFLDMKYFGGTFTHILIQILSSLLRSGGRDGGGSDRRGGGGSAGGGGAGRNF
ncbi:uncharacterized protein J2S13_002208 [Oikeobacillus pervagus]|uniref:TPM domain-containing protein n=1 Tax=Oikeobacillus pervagus TaxID=1325931 RepID=A0AAJ1WJR4_9BACI|nr:TPM domain-containing protein [Oikeobacillus pervagus]MDQ0215788.1 uncharacterized protein [Oikeobacillus pervagus]